MSSSTYHRQNEALVFAFWFKEYLVREPIEFHPADRSACGIEMTGKSSCRDSSQCCTKVCLEKSRQIVVDFSKKILRTLKIRSRSRVVRQLIAKSHTLLLC